MDNLVLIAIGGSGARVAQSVVAMAAAGLPAMLLGENFNPTNTQLYVKLVDIDIHHHDGQELYNMIETYNATIGNCYKDAENAFNSKKWKPMPIKLIDPAGFICDAGIKKSGVARNTVERMVNGMAATPKLLLDSLLGEDDRHMDLSWGCKARPRIGALLWEKLFLTDPDRFWLDVLDLVAPGNNTHIMFVGSVFGGTGASGVPALSKAFRRRATAGMGGTNDTYGITLMAPYFTLSAIDPATGEPAEVDATKFSFESLMSMGYYESDPELLAMDCIQIVGDEPQNMRVRNENGEVISITYTNDASGDQNNPSMPAELVAAIGIHQFFAGQLSGVKLHEHFVPDDTNMSRIYDQTMFPASAEVGICLSRLTRFCLTALMYCNVMANETVRHPRRRAAFFHNLWTSREQHDPNWMAANWNDSTTGVGNVLSFADAMFRWLDDLDLNGMADILHINGNSQGSAVVVAEKGSRGRTDFNIQGTPGQTIIKKLNDETNSFFKAIHGYDAALIPQIRQRAFFKALLCAAEEL